MSEANRKTQVIVSAPDGVFLDWLIGAITQSYMPGGKKHYVHIGQGQAVDGLPMGVLDVRVRP